MDETNLSHTPAEQTLRELEAIFRHASVGICFTRNRLITRCNSALEEILGYGESELNNLPTRTLFVSEEDHQQFSRLVAPQLTQDKAINLIWKLQHRDDREITCKISAKAITLPPSDEGTVWLFEDITREEQQARHLKQSMLEFEAIMSNAPVGIIFTANRVITRCNEEFCKTFRSTPEAVIGSPGRSLFASDEDYAEIGRVVTPLLSAGLSATHEMPMRRANGEVFWAQLIAYVLNPADTSQGTIWLITDRSEAKANEELIRTALFENQAILDSAVVGIVFLKNRLVERCNPHAERLLGYAPGTLSGKSTREWYLTQEDFDYVARDIYPAIAKGHTHVREQRLRRQNGEQFWCRIAGRVFDVANPIDGGSIWVLDDTSERHAAEEALIGATALMQAVFNSANVSIIATHTNGIIRLMNATAQRWLGYSADSLIDHQTPAILHDPAEVVAYAAELSVELGRTIEPGFEVFITKAREFGGDEREWTYIRQDGGRFPIQLSVSSLRDHRGEITGYIGVGVDITDRRRADEAIQRAHDALEERVAQRTIELAETNQRLQQEIVERQQVQETIRLMAHYDALTGLPNRNLLRDRMEQALAQARRNQERIGVLFIDLDHFKTINDSLGHHIGDLLLGQVAQRMSYVVRASDTLARLGGDEFLLLVPELDDPARLALIAEKLTEVLTQPIPIQSHALHITPSIGICCYPEHGEDSETLMRNADTAMYHAKSQGRNSYKFFVESMNTEVDDRFQIESALRYALSRNELDLHYQPLIDTRSRRIYGIEALLRWNSKVLGPISPARFIPIAEDSGTIVPIGAWVLRKACQQVKQWHDQGHDYLLLAVNLSPRQFRQTDLVDMIARTLEETGYPPHALELEITESSLMHNVAEVISTLQKLVALGVRLAIDDFGTGYSSLAYLKNFPVHKLKIDQSFVRDLDADALSVGIVRTIISLATTLGLDVLAEGVETGKQLEHLKALGCHYIQGYLFARPMPAPMALQKIEESMRQI